MIDAIDVYINTKLNSTLLEDEDINDIKVLVQGDHIEEERQRDIDKERRLKDALETINKHMSTTVEESAIVEN